MPHPHPITRRARLAGATLATLAALATAPPHAVAGTYTVTGTCGAWDPYVTPNSGITVFTVCPTLEARNIGGNFTTPAGQGGGWTFHAPAGTWINNFALQGAMLGTRGWQAAGYLEGGATPGLNFEGCPGASCPGAYKDLTGTNYNANGATGIVMRLRCGPGNCPNNEYITGYYTITTASVTLADPSPPNVALTGGSILAPGWTAGLQSVVVNGNDNSGIQEYRVSLDGTLAARSLEACNYGLKVPCPNGSRTLTVSTAGLSDGVHTVGADAVDAS